MKSFTLLASSLAISIGCASSVSDGELLEDTGPDVEKDDGSKLLLIRDKLVWDGQAERTTKVFTSQQAFEDFFGTAAPAEVDWNEE